MNFIRRVNNSKTNSNSAAVELKNCKIKREIMKTIRSISCRKTNSSPEGWLTCSGRWMKNAANSNVKIEPTDKLSVAWTSIFAKRLPK
jgi:hypothetical protein